jgi:hypothetical protein
MSPHVEVLPLDVPLDVPLDADPDPDAEAGAPPPDEALVHCTECEYAAPKSEFVPENYR